MTIVRCVGTLYCPQTGFFYTYNMPFYIWDLWFQFLIWKQPCSVRETYACQCLYENSMLSSLYEDNMGQISFYLAKYCPKFAGQNFTKKRFLQSFSSRKDKDNIYWPIQLCRLCFHWAAPAIDC